MHCSVDNLIMMLKCLNFVVLYHRSLEFSVIRFLFLFIHRYLLVKSTSWMGYRAVELSFCLPGLKELWGEEIFLHNMRCVGLCRRHSKKKRVRSEIQLSSSSRACAKQNPSPRDIRCRREIWWNEYDTADVWKKSETWNSLSSFDAWIMDVCEFGVQFTSKKNREWTQCFFRQCDKHSSNCSRK